MTAREGADDPARLVFMLHDRLAAARDVLSLMVKRSTPNRDACLED